VTEVTRLSDRRQPDEHVACRCGCTAFSARRGRTGKTTLRCVRCGDDVGALLRL
jgi:hypothetical protein